MNHLWELQKEIESARKKLDDAIGNGYDEDLCYDLSVELDKLIEKYIDLQEKDSLAVS